MVKVGKDEEKTTEVIDEGGKDRRVVVMVNMREWKNKMRKREGEC